MDKKTISKIIEMISTCGEWIFRVIFELGDNGVIRRSGISDLDHVVQLNRLVSIQPKAEIYPLRGHCITVDHWAE